VSNTPATADTLRAVLAQIEKEEPACACHSVPGECCPDRIAGLPDPGPEGFGPASRAIDPRELPRRIDHTLLRPEATEDQIDDLCREAREHGFATVCVNPAWVGSCAEHLRRAEPRVCTVAGFPLGASVPEVKVFEAARAVVEGATEVDMVMNVGALRSRDYRLVHRDIAGVVEASHGGGALVKVILETVLLTDREKARACVLARLAGADFVKTSTGFGPGGATTADVALLRRVVGSSMGVKASGGVRDLKTALAMIEAGADRIGTSSGVAIVREIEAGPRS
jgi:deoxyribose-phosphate aldolase